MVVTLHLISKTPAEVRWHCWARVSCQGMQCSEQTWACAHFWEGERKTLSPKRVSITALDVLSGLTLSWLTCLTLCLQVFFIFTFWLCCICTAVHGLLQLWHLGSLVEVYAFGSHLKPHRLWVEGGTYLGYGSQHCHWSEEGDVGTGSTRHSGLSLID